MFSGVARLEPELRRRQAGEAAGNFKPGDLAENRRKASGG